MIRFLVPFFTICLIEIILLSIEDKNINLPRIFLLGAYGPGSYYVPIMLQLLVIFPVIYMLVARNAKLGIFVAGIANLLFEVGVEVLKMDKYYYRLSIGRYLLLIAFGCLSLSSSGTAGEASSDDSNVCDWHGIYCCRIWVGL